VEQQLFSAAVVGFTPIERAGLTLLLRECGVAMACICDQLDEVDAGLDHLSVVVIDLGSYAPGDASSITALSERVEAFRAVHGAIRIVGVSKRAAGIQSVLESAGIDTFVDADARPELLIEVLTGAILPRRPWSRPTISLLPLTSREREVLALIASGRTSRSVATALGISIHTVESHKQRMFRRLGVQNQAQAVAVALRLGLLDDADCVNGAAS
jgi:DNA-binding CsgD family transcriptional regulator